MFVFNLTFILSQHCYVMLVQLHSFNLQDKNGEIVEEKDMTFQQ
jgi:hypothetical protein